MKIYRAVESTLSNCSAVLTDKNFELCQYATNNFCLCKGQYLQRIASTKSESQVIIIEEGGLFGDNFYIQGNRHSKQTSVHRSLCTKSIKIAIV